MTGSSAALASSVVTTWGEEAVEWAADCSVEVDGEIPWRFSVCVCVEISGISWGGGGWRGG